MYQPLIKFHPHPAIITQVLRIFATEIAIAGVSGLFRAEIIPIDLIRIMPA